MDKETAKTQEEYKENSRILEKTLENPKKIFLIAAVVSLLIFFMIGGLILFNSNTGQTGKTFNSKLSTVNPSPTPSPFQEMTIPYLRLRPYESSLGKLNQATETTSYIGYLASYDSDGLRVNGYLTIPKGDPSAGSGQVRPIGGWPAIIFVHGYIPPASYQTLVNYSPYVDYLASNGFVVFKIDLRGFGSSEGEASGAYYSSDYIVDVLNARAALQVSDFVDPDKIGLWGHSMAGNVVLRSFAARPEIPVAVIWAGAVYSYSDWKKYGINDGSYRAPENISEHQKGRKELYAAHGEFNTDSPFWKKVVATNYLKELKGAIQLNHAVDDTVVDIGFSRDLNSLLDKTRVPHELNEFTFGGHNFTGVTFNNAMQNTVEFFKKYLE